MENVNSAATAALRQQQNFYLQQQQDQQQHEHQQQFCLRWHNHQTSLLSTLPVLLDQSHLTDVTISAEGRTLRAHRVVLSACSTFFLELFRNLDVSNHPVIILPGASFAAMAALLTFMYSGEVNVYEDQIPVLLNLAETLGVKGLADVKNNKSASKRRSMDFNFEQPQPPRKREDILDMQSLVTPMQVETPTPPPASASAPPIATNFNTPPQQIPPLTAAMHPFANPLLASKFPPQLENFFLKSLQFYPNLLPQPVNFSQTALNKTTELLAKYQQQCNLYQGALSTLAGATNIGTKEMQASASENFSTQHRFTTTSSPSKPLLTHEDQIAMKRFCTGDKLQTCSLYMQQQQQQQHQQQQHHQNQQQQKDIKSIDKIADSLRCGNSATNRQSITCDNSITPHLSIQSPHSLKASQSVSSFTTAVTSSVCNFPPSIPAQLGTTKPQPIYTTAAATALRNQSPQQYITSMPQASTSGSAFEQSIEEQAARSLQQQLEQLASSTRPFGGCGGGSCSDIGLMTSNQKNYDGSDINQLKSSPTAADRFHASNKAASVLALPTSPGANAAQGKTPSNSKLYATCFICHKQLSNQYNLRVHLETHQNVRYSCNVCSHVSRSKDALRKHVSYRHPGAPSPCETEARRKRASKLLLASGNGVTNNSMLTISPPVACVSNTNIGAALDSGNSSASSNSSEAQIAAAAAHLNSAAAAYMFLPNQFHLAAAAAAVVQQQHQQQQQQQQKQQLDQQPSTPDMQAFSASTENSPATLEIDPTLTAVSSATAPVPIKQEQHSPSTTEQTLSPAMPQLQQQVKCETMPINSSGACSNKDHDNELPRSSAT